MNSTSPLSAVTIDEILAGTYGRVLVDAGFSPISKRRWARPRLEWCCDVFELQSLKGATISARWGLSLSYVPQVKGDRLRWHRTLKSAILDLTIDPVDFLEPGSVAGQALSTFDEAEEMRSTAARLSGSSIAEAAQTWNAATSVHDVALLLERRRSATAVRFGFYNYIQHPLAYAFTLAKIGRITEARTELGKALDDIVPAVHESLRAALEEAHPGTA